MVVVETKSTVNIISTGILISSSKDYTLYISPFGSRTEIDLVRRDLGYIQTFMGCIHIHKQEKS